MKTSTQVLREFDEAGVSISEWARLNGFGREIVSQVLTGKLKGRRGQAHAVKVALGMKAGRVVDATAFMPAKKGGAQ